MAKFALKKITNAKARTQVARRRFDTQHRILVFADLKQNILSSLLQKTASKMTDWMTRNPQINDSPNLLGHPVFTFKTNFRFSYQHVV